MSVSKGGHDGIPRLFSLSPLFETPRYARKTPQDEVVRVNSGQKESVLERRQRRQADIAGPRGDAHFGQGLAEFARRAQRGAAPRHPHAARGDRSDAASGRSRGEAPHSIAGDSSMPALALAMLRASFSPPSSSTRPALLGLDAAEDAAARGGVDCAASSCAPRRPGGEIGVDARRALVDIDARWGRRRRTGSRIHAGIGADVDSRSKLDAERVRSSVRSARCRTRRSSR